MAEQLCENVPLSLKAITRSLRELEESMPEVEAMKAQDEIGWPVARDLGSRPQDKGRELIMEDGRVAGIRAEDQDGNPWSALAERF